MKILKIMVVISFAFFFNAAHYANAMVSQATTYKNQRGSIMVLTKDVKKGKTGTLSGTFITVVGNCKQDIGVPMPLIGFFNGNAVAVTVNFPHCKQVVAMTGTLTNDEDNLHTIWLDATQAKDPVKENWNSNIIGADIYKKTN